MANHVREDSPSHQSVTERPRKEKRQFVLSWKTEFPWVTYDRSSGMHCQYCIDAVKNAFTKGCDKFKKDTLNKHLQTVDHRAAIEAKAGKRDIQQALSHAYKDQ